MDEKIVDQLLDELVTSLEDAETQGTAIMLFLKGEGIATEEKLAPYLKQAGKASDVRWRAARARLGALLHSAIKPAEPSERKTDEAGAATKPEKFDADNASRSKERSQADGKPENTSPQNNNEKSGSSKGRDDAKAVTPGTSRGDATPGRSQQTGNSQTSGSEASSDRQASSTSTSSSDKPSAKN
jgi:hypothetical protein